MVRSSVNITKGMLIKIVSKEEMISLGYLNDDPSMLQYAGKVFFVKKVSYPSEDLRHVYCKGSSRVFIDADIEEVSSFALT